MAVRANTVFNFIVLAIGCVGLAFVLDRLGWSGIRRIGDVGLWFVAIAVIDLCGAVCDAFAIQSFLRGNIRDRSGLIRDRSRLIAVSYWRIFAAQISGMSINRLTPGSTLGEPVKVTMLVRDVPTNLAVSAIVSFNLCTTFVGIASIAIGVPVTLLMLDLPSRVAIGVSIGTGVLVAIAIALVMLVRRGAVATLIGGLVAVRAISVERASRWRIQLAEIDVRLRALGDRGGGLARGLSFVIGSRSLYWLGTVLVLHAAKIPMTAPLVIASLSVGILITWLSNVIPLGVGVADGANYAMYGLLGASPEAGLLFTMVNRLRTCVVATMGLAVMAFANIVHRRGDRPQVAGPRQP